MTYKLNKKYYKVKIDAVISGSSLIGITSGKTGFIDNITAEEWKKISNPPSNLGLSREKARANLRFEEIVNNLNEIHSLTELSNISNGGASEDTPGSAFSFSIIYDRGEYVFVENEFYGVSSHPTYAQKFLYNEDAIKRNCAKAIARDFNSKKRFVLDTNTSGETKWIIEYVVVSSPIEGSDVYKISKIEEHITVTPISGL